MTASVRIALISLTTGASSTAAASAAASASSSFVLDDLEVAFGRPTISSRSVCICASDDLVELSIVLRSVNSPGDDREDVVARDELEVVDDAEVRRVRHRHGQGPPVALERQHEILHRQIGRDELRDLRIDLELRRGRPPASGTGGPAVLVMLDFLDEAQLDQVVVDAAAVLLLLALRPSASWSRVIMPFPDESIADAVERQGRCRGRATGSPSGTMVQTARGSRRAVGTDGHAVEDAPSESPVTAGTRYASGSLAGAKLLRHERGRHVADDLERDRADTCRSCRAACGGPGVDS